MNFELNSEAIPHPAVAQLYVQEQSPWRISTLKLTKYIQKSHILNKFLEVLFVWLQLTSNNLYTMQFFTLISSQYGNSQHVW